MIKLQVSYRCAATSCHAVLNNLVSLDSLDTTKARFGDLIVCNNCGTPNVVELTGLRLLTEEESSTMPEDYRKELSKVHRKIRNQSKTS